MSEELIQRFKQKAEVVAAEVFIAPGFEGALDKALELLREEEKFKITADDGVLRRHMANGENFQHQISAGFKEAHSDGSAGLAAGVELLKAQLKEKSENFELLFPEKPEEFAELQAALVEADFGVAETGTLVHLDKTPMDRWRWTLPEVCIVFLNKKKIACSVEELLGVFNSYLFSRNNNQTPEISDVTDSSNAVRGKSFSTGKEAPTEADQSKPGSEISWQEQLKLEPELLSSEGDIVSGRPSVQNYEAGYGRAEAEMSGLDGSGLIKTESASGSENNSLGIKQISFVTGPSRTADIEGQLELGVHGPLRLLIYIY